MSIPFSVVCVLKMYLPYQMASVGCGCSQGASYKGGVEYYVSKKEFPIIISKRCKARCCFSC